MPKRKNIFIYDYAQQKKILGKYYQEYTAFHHSASCRNLAHYLAYKQGYDVAIALDYDCVVPENYINQHLKALEGKEAAITTDSKWINPLENNVWFTRGFPYAQRGDYKKENLLGETDKRVVLNMGLWKNVVDINGIDKVLETPPVEFKLNRENTAVDGYIPLCGMNNAFVKDIIPAYFFLPNFMVGNWEVSRHDDIWGGYILQKLIEKKGDILTYGAPVVFHERESSQPKVLHYEHFMHMFENYFYPMVDEATASIRKADYQDMFAEFAQNYRKVIDDRKKSMPDSYYKGFSYLGDFIKLWSTFFQEL